MGNEKPIGLQFFKTHWPQETDALSPLVIFRPWEVGIISKKLLRNDFWIIGRLLNGPILGYAIVTDACQN